MRILLKRYWAGANETKSVMSVYMGEEPEARMVCEAREALFFDYQVSFMGASHYCLPRGTYKMKVGNSPYGPMGLRIPRCPGHRCVFIGHSWSRQSFEGEILIGMPYSYNLEEQTFIPTGELRQFDSLIKDGEETFARLNKLVYEAYANGEDFWITIDNSEVEDHQLKRNLN